MTRPTNDQLTGLVRSALADAMPAHGFITPPASDSRWGRWFVPANGGKVPHLEAGITASINDNPHGGLSITGFLTIRSVDATAVLIDLPAEALISTETEDRLHDGVIERPFFGEFLRPENHAIRRSIARVEDVQSLVDWFVGFSVKTEVTDWFVHRNSLDRLIALSQTASPGAESLVNPHLLRCVVALCLVNDRPLDAVAIVEWYLQRENYNFLDSRDRVIAFDSALIDRYPSYAAGRSGGSY